MKKVEVKYYEGETDHYRWLIENEEDLQEYCFENFCYNRLTFLAYIREGKSIVINCAGGYTLAEHCEYISNPVEAVEL